jgi:hypothetical protein
VSGFDGLDDGGGLVSLGRQLHSLDPTGYRLWEALRAVPTDAAAEALADSLRASSGEDHLTALRRSRLVAVWSSDPADCRALADSHSVRLRGKCLGNGDGGGLTFLVGDLAGEPRARVDVMVYELLLSGDDRASITDECRRLEFDRLELATDPVQHVVAFLPALMRAGLIEVDLAGGGEVSGA